MSQNMKTCHVWRLGLNCIHLLLSSIHFYTPSHAHHSMRVFSNHFLVFQLRLHNPASGRRIVDSAPCASHGPRGRKGFPHAINLGRYKGGWMCDTYVIIIIYIYIYICIYVFLAEGQLFSKTWAKQRNWEEQCYSKVHCWIAQGSNTMACCNTLHPCVKGKSWVPLGEYLRYIPTYTTYILDYVMVV